MSNTVDVVYNEDGAIVALGFPPPPTVGNVQQQSGPTPGEGQRAARLDLPPDVTLDHDTLSRLAVDTSGKQHKLTVR